MKFLKRYVLQNFSALASVDTIWDAINLYEKINFYKSP
jgi:hypothetical protein